MRGRRRESAAAAAAGISKDIHKQNYDHMPVTLSILFFLPTL